VESELQPWCRILAWTTPAAVLRHNSKRVGFRALTCSSVILNGKKCEARARSIAFCVNRDKGLPAENWWNDTVYACAPQKFRTAGAFRMKVFSQRCGAGGGWVYDHAVLKSKRRFRINSMERLPGHLRSSL